ncbi:hypothetical protein [Flavobacterium sp.]|uniref:hypothetical protein n=1 Tax=Flavobacterium sp. TaxID=239 RepID=UPI00374FE644
MSTKYTKKIIYYLEGDSPDEEMMEWVEKQPLIDQPDILREFKKLCQEKFDKVGIFNFDFEEIDRQIEVYEEAILTEKLAEANLVMAQQDLDKQMQLIDETVAGVRKYVIESIINNEENAEAMKELAQKIIAGEKENDVYDENNWKEIL